MLQCLEINNFATIQHIKVSFNSGFSILTGETGAGKSIIIDAIQLILGRKSDISVIRSGKSDASVEAVFQINLHSALATILKESNIRCDNGTLVIRRVIQQEGRQKSLINGTSIPLAKLSTIGRYLVNIHGQHDNQALMQVASHIDFLDDIGKLTGQREAVGQLFEQYEAALQEQQRIKGLLKLRTERMELLAFQRNEIEKAQLDPDEEDRLQQEATLLSHAEKLSHLFGQIKAELYEAENAVIDRVRFLLQSVEEAVQLDPRCIEMQRVLDETLIQLDEIYRQACDYDSNIEHNPEHLDQTNERLNEIQWLKRKYKVETVKALLENLERNKVELEELENLDIEAQEIQDRISQLKTQLQAESLTLSENRIKAAMQLDKQVVAEMHQLGMEKAIFQTIVLKNISTNEEYQFSPTGIDHVEFLMTVNPGQELRSLIKVASGGELSRIMLALKTVLAFVDPVDTLIFDEVDAGISGKVAEIVGKKLHSLGKHHQTLCITHLPQVVAFSENHLVVTKDIQDNATFTSIRQLEAHEKIEELARLMGGSKITQRTLEHAQEMLKMTQTQN
ncbi:DNA repair protein RecN [Deltaproteobacteria bacterium TL4]